MEVSNSLESKAFLSFSTMVSPLLSSKLSIAIKSFARALLRNPTFPNTRIPILNIPFKGFQLLSQNETRIATEGIRTPPPPNSFHETLLFMPHVLKLERSLTTHQTATIKKDQSTTAAASSERGLGNEFPTPEKPRNDQVLTKKRCWTK
jgi:hypothetical protein